MTAATHIAVVRGEAGSGPPLVYVPGLDGSGELLLGTAERLAQRFRLVRIAYRTTGPPPRGGDSYASLAESIAARLDELGIERALVVAKPQLDEAGIRVESKASPEIGPVNADAGQLEQVFLNLVLNALQAMPDGGTLAIGLERGKAGDAASIVARFGDTGIGMSRQTLEHIFMPFYTNKEKGSGLGLAIATLVLEPAQMCSLPHEGQTRSRAERWAKRRRRPTQCLGQRADLGLVAGCCIRERPDGRRGRVESRPSAMDPDSIRSEVVSTSGHQNPTLRGMSCGRGFEMRAPPIWRMRRAGGRKHEPAAR